ncbi:acyl-CoA dehydrogenase family protein [Jatrophihabitans telluris]|uniref:Acyl-CoA dehydrogenase family protein n=1 Tax=Jatrophihabitans telluris TaxID=2038343 RepID=A0ABY4QZD7_9ACTN|nr:acyl-CoA dehydrogenase family protein [Jatrophihabitans telluris]UQX88983.1 acyl-CoA dehydrogenase family protein [Jatrophihabitans telluris]
MDFTVSNEWQVLVDTLRSFCEDEVDPLWREIEESNAIPEGLLEKAGQLGLFGLSIPEEYGGLGLPMVAKALVYEQLGRTHAGFTSIIGTHCGIGVSVIVAAGSEEQKQRYLPSLASGEVIGAFALTEPEAGSDAGNLRLRAIRDGEGWRLTGTKHYITNSKIAGLFTVFARTGESGGKGISAFVVEAGAPGFEVGRAQTTMGLRGSHVAELSFDGCWVPDDQMIGAPGTGYQAALSTLAQGRVGIAARCVGAASRATELALTFATQREQFGSKIAEFQMIQAYLAEMAAETEAARHLAYYAAWLLDQGGSARREAAMAKLIATETYGRVVDKAVQIHGGMGYCTETEIEHFYRDARITRIYEGTSEIQKLVIARDMIRKVRGR